MGPLGRSLSLTMQYSCVCTCILSLKPGYGILAFIRQGLTHEIRPFQIRARFTFYHIAKYVITVRVLSNISEAGVLSRFFLLFAKTIWSLYFPVVKLKSTKKQIKK